MKRRAIMILLLLAGGAIVNVAVAWACASVINPFVGPLVVTERNGDGSGRMEPGTQQFATRIVHTYSSRSNLHEEPDSVFKIIEARGWPALAVSMDRDDYLQPTFGFVLPFRPFTLPLTSLAPRGGPRALPLRPIWPGFAINTVFYAFILWLLFAAPFALRRRRRIKRGLCPKCAYPRGAGTNEVCTECGAAVPRNVETSTRPNVQSSNS